MSAPWIVVEGLDGTGKSSLAAGLAARLGGRLLATPGSELSPFRAAILDGLGRDPEALVAFYGATVIARGRQARAMTACGVPVVMDRYLASTVAYARAREVGLRLDWLLEVAPLPDIELLVTLPEAVRRERLAARGLGPEDRETLVPAFADRVLAVYRALMPRCVEISNLDDLDLVTARLATAILAPRSAGAEAARGI